jgi:hypothetical protein
MRKYLSGLAFLLAGFASQASAQYQTIITPPPGGVPIVSGGWYTVGTVFSNGVAYPYGTPVQEVSSVAQASYYTPQFNSYPSYSTAHSGSVYRQGTYYTPGYSSFGLGYSFGTGGYNRGYTGNSFSTYPGYGGFSSFGTGYGGGNSGNRGYRGNRGYGGRRR